MGLQIVGWWFYLHEISDDGLPALNIDMLMTAEFEKRRMFRFFGEDGRSLIVAMDHGIGLNVYPALTEPDAIIEELRLNGADGFLVNYGVLSSFSESFKAAGVILRVDGGSTELEGGREAHKLLYSVEDALKLGADGVACMGFPGSPWETETLANVAELARQCRTWNVPLMAEMAPGGFVEPSKHTAANIRLAARVGVELGADLIKAPFAGSPEEFGQVTEHCFKPVLVLGGGGTRTPRELLMMVRSALDAGAAGVVIGRNIWGNRPHIHAGRMVKALAGMIHSNASVDEAAEVYQLD